MPKKVIKNGSCKEGRIEIPGESFLDYFRDYYSFTNSPTITIDIIRTREEFTRQGNTRLLYKKLCQITKECKIKKILSSTRSKTIVNSQFNVFPNTSMHAANKRIFTLNDFKKYNEQYPTEFVDLESDVGGCDEKTI